MTTPSRTRSSDGLRLAGDLGRADALERLDVGVARRQQHLGRHLQECVDQRFEVRPRLAHRLLVGLGDIDGVRPGELVGRGLVAGLLGLVAVHLEHARDDGDGRQRLRVGVAHLRRPLDRAARPLRRNPDRRMRRLVRPRPRVHVVEVVVLAGVLERAGLGPGADDQVVRLRKALLREARVDAHGVIFGADAAHEARDDAAAREIVEHRVFFGDHQRIVHQRQRAAEDRDLRLLDAARERARERTGRRHHAVGGLVVLVEADAVEAEPVGQLHLVEILVIELGAFFRIVVAVGIGDPGGAVLLDGVEVGVPVRHQVKVEELHAAALFFSRKPSSAVTKAWRCSICGR